MHLNYCAREDSRETLDSKEIQPVNHTGNQPWIFIKRTVVEAEAPILCPPDAEATHWKRPWCCKRLKVGGEGNDRGWDGQMASLINGHEFEQAPRDSEGQGSLACCSPWGHKESNTTEWLNSNNKGQVILRSLKATGNIWRVLSRVVMWSYFHLKTSPWLLSANWVAWG